MNASPISGATDSQAEFTAPVHRNHFAIAGIRLRVSGDAPEAVRLAPHVAPFACDAGDSDIAVEIQWRPRLESSRAKEIFHSGAIWSAHQSKGKLLFDFTAKKLSAAPYKRLLADADFQRAEVHLNGELFPHDDRASALEYPLDELLVTHHLSLGRGVELHACGLVEAGGESFLFSGHSGAGKSTTARLWTRHCDVEVLSDDRIIVRKSGNHFTMYGTPWHGEAAFASPGQAPVRRIFLLEHGTSNRIEKISRTAAVGELLARSFVPFYQPRFVEPVLALLESLVDSLPCYRYQFVPDRSAVERILEFRD